MSKGFTFIELLVTVSIFTIISSFLLISYSQFSARASLRKTAQEVALAIRETQVFALIVRKAGALYPGYGIHFDITAPNSFIIFSDINNDNAYNAGELVKQYQIISKDSISNLCSGVETLPPGICSLSNLDIVYLRPRPKIAVNGVEFNDAEIRIQSDKGYLKKIKVWPSGQIEIRD
ncbi:MAG: prepilin-type N-terminal cleavage/methylation domain-containing protein [Patescibacteria group bacterium]